MISSCSTTVTTILPLATIFMDQIQDIYGAKFYVRDIKRVAKYKFNHLIQQLAFHLIRSTSITLHYNLN